MQELRFMTYRSARKRQSEMRKTYGFMPEIFLAEDRAGKALWYTIIKPITLKKVK